jgi:hypothetical protein
MFMAKQGWLGPEIGAQSRQIERTMAAGLVGVYQNPQAASSAASAAIQTYPWQFGARLGTNTFLAARTGLNFEGGVLLGFASAEGSLAHLAFNAGENGLSPEAITLATAVGHICRRPGG